MKVRKHIMIDQDVEKAVNAICATVDREFSYIINQLLKEALGLQKKKKK